MLALSNKFQCGFALLDCLFCQGNVHQQFTGIRHAEIELIIY
jgi:hypothetical protein